MPHAHQHYMSDSFIDITTDSEFFGLSTFANIPYVNCLKADETQEGRYDIAILGAPFDTVSVVARGIVPKTGTDNLDRVSLVDLVLGLALLESAEDHNALRQLMLGTSTQVPTPSQSMMNASNRDSQE